MGGVRSRAPGKLILVGEHAVVYGRPAIAVPVHGLFAEATITEGREGSGVRILASDLNQTISSSDADDHPLIQTVRHVYQFVNVETGDIEIHLSSTIPMAAGFGSGAAVSAAIVQALGEYLKHPLTPMAVSDIVYKTETIHHGTPSGIDNTVIALGTPIYFVKGKTPQPAAVAERFLLVIGDTGIPVATHVPVGEVRSKWQADPESYEAIFDEIGVLVDQAADALAAGNIATLGTIMTENHTALAKMGVSSEVLNSLVDAALTAGALGAKLSGAGQGGNMIALVTEETADRVAESLLTNGAAATYRTWVEKA